ncbi:hypothetical protein Rhe02_44830 [Rhizocola hellebori]|uniref:DUF2690 domain-containing protein n=1 Tax=Rhizocola hellebori TaxID=1392758 RepID=A0A8J3VHW1_9ACTN|nr:DUF2690 domain-containing protein [Rhizocola hellebori]GIH06416.1 hypothetical protein Rhe02_44830 [Rhizocola hellebori]
MQTARHTPPFSRLMSTVVMVVATAVISLTAVTPAEAATTIQSVGCNGATCAGRDPSNMGCATDGYTVQLVGVDPLGVWEGLELRYSPACNANWARLTAQSYYGAWVSLCVVNDANRNDIQCLAAVRNGYLWSPMIDGHKKVFASVGYSLDSGGSGNRRTGAF